MLCMATSGGDPVFADSVDESDSFDDVGKASVAIVVTERAFDKAERERLDALAACNEAEPTKQK